MTTLPALINLTAYRGDTWAQVFRFKTDTVPLDLTGATVAAWAQLQSGTVVVLDATVVSALAGEVRIGLPAGTASGSYTYDVEVTQAGTVTTWVRGTLTVTTDVTHAALAS